MDSPEVQKSVSPENRFPVDDPQTIREMMVAFSRALKNHGIYPSDHAVSRNAIADLKTRLDEALLHREQLRLEVEKDRLLHEGKPVYPSAGNEGDLPAVLFRDGIRWIAFENGIETDEIRQFLEILQAHKHLKDEAEGDIVTALWDAGLPHLRYDAADVLWDAEPLSDFGTLELDLSALQRKTTPSKASRATEPVSEDAPSAPDGETGPEDAAPLEEPSLGEASNDEAPVKPEELQEEDEPAESPESPKSKDNQPTADRKTYGVADFLETQEEVLSIASPEIDRDLWKLTEAEKTEIREMVIEEENWNSIGDVLDVLLVILQEQQTEEDFSTILEFMTEEFQMTLEQMEFQLAATLLDNLDHLKKKYSNRNQWAGPSLDRFYDAISGPDVLNAIDPLQWDIAEPPKNQLKALRRLLLHLRPGAAHSLGLMLPKVADTRIRKLFMEAIGSLANTDPFCLEKLLKHPDEELVQRIVFILGYLKHPDAVQLLIKMLSHPSEPIRKRAMKAVISRGSGVLPKLFPLIEDPSPEIREKILDLLSRRKSRQSETLLLEYLTEGRFGIQEPRHVIACYRALGKCGSHQAIPFLRAALLEKGWRGIIGLEKPHERQGAAMALMELKLEAADDILQNAAQSRFASIRSAYEKAFEAMK